jgi:tetratricopeptide (TPR) repeat protein
MKIDRIDKTASIALARARAGAHKAFLQKDYETSIVLDTQVLESVPNDPLSLKQRGIAYLDQGELEKARTDLMAALQAWNGFDDATNIAQEQTVEILWHLARAYWCGADLLETPEACADLLWAAQGIIADAIRLAPEQIQNWTLLADIYQKQWRTSGIAYYAESALEGYTKAIELAPKSPEAYVPRAAVYNSFDEPDMAIADFSRALELGSGDLETIYSGLSKAWHQKEEYEKEAEALTKLIELVPDHAAYHEFRGLAFFYDDKLPQAMQDFDRAIELASGDPDSTEMRAESWMHKGQVFTAMEKPLKAIECFEEAVKLRGEWPPLLESRGDAWFAHENFESALADYLQAWNTGGVSRHTAERLAELLQRDGSDEAMRERERILEMLKSNPEPNPNKGE